MKDPVFLREKEKYEKIWNRDIYRLNSPGSNSLPSFLTEIAERISPGDSIIDFGCGTGVCSLSLLEKGLNVSLVDIAANCLDEKIAALTHIIPDRISFVEAALWDLPESLRKSDWIYCIDVLEHLPTQKVIESLEEMSGKTKKGGALQVFLADEGMGFMIGETLHLTIRPLDWWIKQISSFWSIEKIEELIAETRYCIYVGAPYKRSL